MGKKAEAERRRRIPDQEEARQIGAEFANESDRGAILIGAAMADRHLGALLERKVSVSSSLKRQEIERLLFVGQQPLLQNFGARILIAQAFGVIDEGTSKALMALKALRNERAHREIVAPLTWDNAKAILSHLGDFGTARLAIYEKRGGAPNNLRTYFAYVVIALCRKLDILSEDLERAGGPTSV